MSNEDGIILPPEILSQQVCSACHKHLSVGPVLVTRKGRTICGRCKVGSKEHATPSLYNQIAAECLFPCTNQGCRELIPFTQMKDHEEYCSTKTVVSCPFCNYKADERRLVQHFKEKHSEYVVDDKFEVIPRKGVSRNLIFLKDGHVMCVNVVAGDKFLKISNTLLTPSASAFEHFTLSFFKFHDGIHFVTPHIRITRNSDRFLTDYGTGFDEEAAAGPYLCQENSFLLAKDPLASCIQSDSYHCKMDYVGNKEGDQVAKSKLNSVEKCRNLISSLELPRLPTKTNGFKKVDCILKMDTAAVRQFIKSKFVKMQRCAACRKSVRTKNDAFFCPMEHLACRNCLTSKCGKCYKFVQWSSLSKWHCMSLRCEWDCDRDVDVFEYMRHVQLCGARQYKCPDRNCTYVGRLDDFKRHWHLDTIQCGETLKLAWTDWAFYWLLPHLCELVYVTVERLPFDYFYITLYNYDVVLPKSYKLYGGANLTIESEWVLLKNLGGRFLQRRKGSSENTLYLIFKKVD